MSPKGIVAALVVGATIGLTPESTHPADEHVPPGATRVGGSCTEADLHRIEPLRGQYVQCRWDFVPNRTHTADRIAYLWHPAAPHMPAAPPAPRPPRPDFLG